MLTARKAKSKLVGLTVGQATREARKIVNATMPNVMATVESRHGWDVTGDQQTVITTITFPETADASDVACWAERAPGVISSAWSPTRIVITRKVN